MDTQATRTAKAPRGRLAVTAAGGSTPAPKTRGMPSTALVVVAVCLVGVAIVAHAAATGRNTVFGHPVLVVLSGSMSPAIRTGDLIVDDPVSGAAAQRLHVGQATTFSDGPGSSRYVTHRIVGVVHRSTGVLYRTKGDANRSPDTALRPASDVIGTVAARLPHGGYVLADLHGRAVLAVAFALPLLWLVLPLRRRKGGANDNHKRKAGRR